MSWTKAEVAAYQPRKDDYLQSLYAIPGLPPTDPEGRARFLAEHALTLTRTDRILVRREALKCGNHVALALLEDLAIEAREEQTAPHEG